MENLDIPKHIVYLWHETWHSSSCGGIDSTSLYSTVAFRTLQFEVSQIRFVARRIKIHHSDTSVDRSIWIVRQLEQIFQQYRTTFKELRGGGSCIHHEVPAGKRKTLKKILHCFMGGRQFAYIRFSPGVLEPNPDEERGMSCRPLWN